MASTLSETGVIELSSDDDEEYIKPIDSLNQSNSASYQDHRNIATDHFQYSNQNQEGFNTIEEKPQEVYESRKTYPQMIRNRSTGFGSEIQDLTSTESSAQGSRMNSPRADPPPLNYVENIERSRSRLGEGEIDRPEKRMRLDSLKRPSSFQQGSSDIYQRPQTNQSNEYQSPQLIQQTGSSEYLEPQPNQEAKFNEIYQTQPQVNQQTQQIPVQQTQSPFYSVPIEVSSKNQLDKVSKKSFPNDVEIINISSDEDFSDNIPESEEDLVILDPLDEAVRSKFSSVQPLRALFNQPISAPHVSDPFYSDVNIKIGQLQERRALFIREKQVVGSQNAKVNFEIGQLENTIRNLKDFMKALRGQIEKTLQNNTNLSIDALKSNLEYRIGEVHNFKTHLEAKKSQAKGLDNKLRTLSNNLFATENSLRAFGIVVHAPQPNYASADFPLTNENTSSFAPNIYSSQANQEDIQLLLNNIRPDEDFDSGLELTPPELNIKLMAHQKTGLTWLKRMEKSSKGSILADDMGLGKTIQAISLILANPPQDRSRRTTLILAPVSLLRQWAAEMRSKIKTQAQLTIGIFHGSNKRNLVTFKDMNDHDVILTSYATLSSEWKRHYKECLKQAQEDKVSGYLPRPNEGGKSYESPFFALGGYFHRIILDEAQNIKNKLSLASKAVACLKGDYRLCLSGTPIQNNVNELYPLIRFLGIRPYNNEDKFRADITLPLRANPNYDEMDKSSSMRKLRVLLKAILLRRSKTSLIDGKPILTLPDKHVLSDFVDMQDEEKNFYKYLELDIQSKAKKLLMTSTHGKASNILALLLRLRQACCHRYLVDIGQMKSTAKQRAEEDRFKVNDWRLMLAHLNKLDNSVVNRIKQLDDETEEEIEALGAKIELTDVKNESTDVKKEVSGEIVEVLGADVKNEGDLADLKADVEKVVKIDILDDIEASIKDETPSSLKNESTSLKNDSYGETVTCPVCFNMLTSTDAITIFANCGHMMCQSCVEPFFESEFTDEDALGIRTVNCAECRTATKENELIDYVMFHKVHHEKVSQDELNRFCREYYSTVPADTKTNARYVEHFIDQEGYETSAKIEQCLTLIKKINSDNPQEKIIVFSQFTTLFDVMKYAFDRENVEFLRYDGTMNLDQKNDTIKRFYQEDIKVLLISLKAGNTGLTLTCASHVIMMDPFWNPYVEEQAMDRAHRIGQEREVFVHRLLISGTVESRIMDLQEQKKELVGAALDEGGLKQVSSLGKKELGFLFGLNSL